MIFNFFHNFSLKLPEFGIGLLAAEGFSWDSLSRGAESLYRDLTGQAGPDDTLEIILIAVLPIFLLIFLGFLAKARRFPGEGFWEPAERLIYFALLPALLVTTLADADLSGLNAPAMAGAIAAATVALTLLLLALQPLLGLSGPAFTSLYQGSVRQNTYIGLAVAFGVFGAAGLAAAAVAVAVIVPLTNLLAVVLHAHFARTSRSGIVALIKLIALNPMILACLTGIALNVTGIGLPPVVRELLEIMARAALPLGLLAVGAGLDLAAARRGGRAVALAVVLKLAVLPALTAAGCWAFEVTGVAAFTAILFNGIPTAASTYILARQMGGDAKLMASIITLQVIASALTLPIILTILV
jgi:predicted permease